MPPQKILNPLTGKFETAVLTSNGLEPRSVVDERLAAAKAAASIPANTIVPPKSGQLSEKRIDAIVKAVNKIKNVLDKLAKSNGIDVTVAERLESASKQFETFPIHKATEFGLVFLNSGIDILNTIIDGTVPGASKDHIEALETMVETITPLATEVKGSITRKSTDSPQSSFR